VRRPSTKLAAELRLQETGLGGSAMDRQRLRWALPDPETKAAVSAPSGVAQIDDARRKRLTG